MLQKIDLVLISILGKHYYAYDRHVKYIISYDIFINKFNLNFDG